MPVCSDKRAGVQAPRVGYDCGSVARVSRKPTRVLTKSFHLLVGHHVVAIGPHASDRGEVPPAAPEGVGDEPEGRLPTGRGHAGFQPRRRVGEEAARAVTPQVERLATTIAAGVASTCAAGLSSAASLALKRPGRSWQELGNDRSGRWRTSRRGLAGSRASRFGGAAGRF